MKNKLSDNPFIKIVQIISYLVVVVSFFSMVFSSIALIWTGEIYWLKFFITAVIAWMLSSWFTKE
jgi:hypothetical protein